MGIQIWSYVGRDDLLTLDEDNDGFNTSKNLSKTDPSDPDSHPPFTSKMVLSEIKEYICSDFRTGDNPERIGVREEATRFEADPPRIPPRENLIFEDECYFWHSS